MSTSKNPINLDKRVLYAGNLLSNHGSTPTTVEVLAPLLSDFCDIQAVGYRKSKISRLLEMWLALIRPKKKIDYLIIDTYSTNAFWYGVILAITARLKSIKYIPILHGGGLPTRLEKNPLVMKKYLSNSAAIVCPSYYMLNYFENRIPGNYCVIKNPISLEDYDYQNKSKISEDPNILWVRSIKKIYNPKLAIDVIAELEKHNVRATLTMVGPDSEGITPMLKAYAQEIGVGHKVTFTGLLEKKDWLALCRGHDIFLNTSSVDNSPLSIIEAMAMGMIVVTTAVGGIPMMVNDKFDSITCNNSSVVNLTSVIMDLLMDKYNVSKISLNARKNALSYDTKTVRNDWYNLLSAS